MSGSGLVASQYVWPLKTCGYMRCLSKCCLSKRVAFQNVFLHVLPLNMRACLRVRSRCLVQCFSVHVDNTGWRRLIGSRKLQIIFHKRAIKYRSLLRKMIYKDKGSYESSPPCICCPSCFFLLLFHICGVLFSFLFDHVFFPTFPPPPIYGVPW